MNETNMSQSEFSAETSQLWRSFILLILQFAIALGSIDLIYYMFVWRFYAKLCCYGFTILHIRVPFFSQWYAVANNVQHHHERNIERLPWRWCFCSWKLYGFGFHFIFSVLSSYRALSVCVCKVSRRNILKKSEFSTEFSMNHRILMVHNAMLNHNSIWLPCAAGFRFLNFSPSDHQFD